MLPPWRQSNNNGGGGGGGVGWGDMKQTLSSQRLAKPVFEHNIEHNLTTNGAWKPFTGWGGRTRLDPMFHMLCSCDIYAVTGVGQNRFVKHCGVCFVCVAVVVSLCVVFKYAHARADRRTHAHTHTHTGARFKNHPKFWTYKS